MNCNISNASHTIAIQTPTHPHNRTLFQNFVSKKKKFNITATYSQPFLPFCFVFHHHHHHFCVYFSPHVSVSILLMISLLPDFFFQKKKFIHKSNYITWQAWFSVCVCVGVQCPNNRNNNNSYKKKPLSTTSIQIII